MMTMDLSCISMSYCFGLSQTSLSILTEKTVVLYLLIINRYFSGSMS